MARILLGVSGGIAAYKALELARLATKEGHAVRVLMTPAAERFVGAASFEGIVGAPVLTDEFERDPTRGAFPGDPVPEHDPIGHLEVVAQRGRLPGRPGLGQHDRQARRRDRRLDGHHLLPRLLRSAARRAGDERPDVPRRRDPGEPGDASRARRHRDRAGGGRARLPRRARRRAASRAAHAARRDRGGGCPDRAVRGTAFGSWSPPAAPASRSTRFASSATAPRGRMGLALAERAARRGAEVTLVAANVSLPAPARGEAGRRRDRRRAGRRPGREFDSADVLLMAAAPADFRPRQAAGRRSTARAAAASSSTWRRPRTSSPRSSAPPARGTRRSSGSPPRPVARLDRAREKLERKGADAIVLNDVSRSEIGFESSENEVVIVERGASTTVPLASKEADRRRDPRPGRGASHGRGRPPAEARD